MADREIKLMEGAYHKGYREGFQAALKLVWAFADELRIRVTNTDKPFIDEFIKKLTL